MKMRPLLLLSALLLGGCSINPYGEPGREPGSSVPSKPATPPVTQPEVPAPVQKPVAPLGLARSMADAFVQAPEVQEIAAKDNPVLLLTPPQNGTSEQLDTRTMAAAMHKRIQSRSGFRFADPAQVSAITSQLEYQQGGMNPASLVRLGRQSGASYMLYGDLTQEGSRYRLSMSLMDLRSGELLWNASRSAGH